MRAAAENGPEDYTDAASIIPTSPDSHRGQELNDLSGAREGIYIEFGAQNGTDFLDGNRVSGKLPDSGRGSIQRITVASPFVNPQQIFMEPRKRNVGKGMNYGGAIDLAHESQVQLSIRPNAMRGWMSGYRQLRR